MRMWAGQGTHSESHQVWLSTVATVVPSEKPDRSKSKRKRISAGCLFFLPAEKAFIDGFGYAALLETQSGFDPAFLPPFLSLLPTLSLTQELEGSL